MSETSGAAQRAPAPAVQRPPAPQGVITPDIANMDNCIADVRRALADGDRGPADPTNFANLRGRLAVLRDTLAPLYRETFYDPYVATLNGLGPTGFNEALTDPNTALLMMDAAHAILQNGEGFQQAALDAFEEVVSDLYDGFLSAEDRSGVKPPDRGVIPPLVKFGNPDFGPYTFPIEATSSLRLAGGTGLGAAIVSLPPAHARLGLLAWSALGHETGGHDILSADTGLKSEIMRVVRNKLQAAGLGRLASYWARRIDETASDVLGILNMGPAAAIGLIGFFRGFSSVSKLRSTGPANDPQPADVLRGFLAAATVKLLSFDGATAWSDIIRAETHKDVTTIRLEDMVVSEQQASQSAELVAEAIAKTELASLEHTALIEIQDWRNEDETIVSQLRDMLTKSTPLPVNLGAGAFAAHAVAAAVTTALTAGADLSRIFQRMITVLKAMHDANPSFGPLFITHPGNIKPDLVFIAGE